MVQGLRVFCGVCLLAVLVQGPAAAAEGAVGVSPLQDDRRTPAAAPSNVPEAQPPVPFEAPPPAQRESAPPSPPVQPGASSAPSSGSAFDESTPQSGTVLAYLIELTRRQNKPCPSSAALPAPPPPLIFSEPLCAVARETANGGDVAAILAAKGLRAARWRSFSAAEVSPQEAVDRLRADYCEALMADVTHIGAIREKGRWWVVMAALARSGSRNATIPPTAGAAPAPQTRSDQPAGSSVPQATAPAAAASATLAGAAPGPGREGEAMLALLNDVRAKGATCRGKAMPPARALTVSPRLEQIARKHAADMAEKKYFSTVSPTGMNLEKRAMEEKYPWKAITELIAKGPPPASAVLDLWLSSPNQCEQLMDPTLRDAGIGFQNEYWALVMGLEAAGANLPPNEEPAGYANNGTLRPAPRGVTPAPAVPSKAGQTQTRRR